MKILSILLLVWSLFLRSESSSAAYLKEMEEKAKAAFVAHMFTKGSAEYYKLKSEWLQAKVDAQDAKDDAKTNSKKETDDEDLAKAKKSRDAKASELRAQLDKDEESDSFKVVPSFIVSVILAVALYFVN